VRVVNALFTANFTNDWLCADCGEGILFISDMDGNVLGEATWTGNASFSIDLPAGLIDLSQKVSVTTVFGGEYSDIFLITNLNVDVGASWTWGKETTEPNYGNPEDVVFEFQNIPNHESFVISSPTVANLSSSSLPNNMSFPVRDNPLDVYLKLGTSENSGKYIWINSVTGGNRAVDLSAMTETESKSIDIDNNSDLHSLLLLGFKNPNDRNFDRFYLDIKLGFISNNSTVVVNYPTTGVFEYFTYLETYEGINITDEQWIQQVFGKIPDALEKIEADFDFVNVSPNDFQISTTNNNFDEILTNWELDNQNTYIEWFVFGPSDLLSYSLPAFSNAVVETYPDLQKDLLKMYSTYINDYAAFDSYEEILDVLYNSPDQITDIAEDIRSRVKYYETKKSSNKKPELGIEDLFSRINHSR